MSFQQKLAVLLTGLSALLFLHAPGANACTGIRLTAENGAVVYGRTMEWGEFNLHSRVAVVPRGHAFTGLTPDGYIGKKWKAAYGFVALDMLQEDVFADGMNEKGLAVGLFYHPGFESYNVYDKRKASDTMTAVDVPAYILSQCATVDEAKAAMKKVRVVPVVDAHIGMAVDAHWMVTDAAGHSLVIEYADHTLKLYDAPLGVITNAPRYDWHLTNLRNYVNLSPVAMPDKKIEDMDFAPLGVGSGMIGLPGDFTPPSRFIRAVAWTQTHRPLPDAGEAVYELFRILDNFNVPLTAAEGAQSKNGKLKDMRSSTQWTTAWDLSERVLYFHTQDDRRVRKVDMNRIDFTKSTIVHLPLDESRAQDVKDITPVN